MVNEDGAASTASAEPGRNEVVLCGRVALAAAERSLPSGDTLLTTRIIVDRPPPRASGSGRSRQRVDAIDCVAWTARLRQAMRRWEPGDQVLVTGSLRRRFYRTGNGPVSRFEVEVHQARRVAGAERSR